MDLGGLVEKDLALCLCVWRRRGSIILTEISGMLFNMFTQCDIR